MTISNQTFERCIEECLQCSRWCSQCRTESLNEDPIMMRDCIRLCNECLELCRTCVLLLTSSSGFAHQVCGSWFRAMHGLRGGVRKIRRRNHEEMCSRMP